jgi:hypothetical protein
MGALPNRAEMAIGDAAVRDADPFSPEALRVTPDAGSIGVRREILSVPVRKPNKQEFFRVRPDEPGQGWHLDTVVLELSEDRETYLVAPALREELAAEGRVARLYTCLSRGGALFLWPVPLPGPDGRANPWHQSAHDIAGRAVERWVRMRSDQAAGMYQLLVATGLADEPDWPDLTFRRVLELAFRERLIAGADHPVVRRLRGLA